MIKVILENHIEKIKKFNKEREDWLKLSLVVTVSISLILIDIFNITDQKFVYFFIGCGLFISAAWWYWTMNIIKEILNHKYYESEILKNLAEDIKDIKKTIKSEQDQLTR